jgi:hypothetical protein
VGTVQEPSNQESYAACIRWAFVRAKVCIKCARAARRRGDSTEFERWVAAAKLLRGRAAEFRAQARNVPAVLLCIVWCLVGCAKVSTPNAPSREFTVNFEVQPSSDGSSIVWSLQFKTREQYHAFLETTAEGAERAKIREMIAASLQLHHIVGCSAQEKAVTRLGDDGIAFIGSCPLAARAVPAGGI